MTKTITGLIATLAVFLLLPATAHAMGTSCPPCYRLDDNDNCVKIPGTCIGTTPKCGGKDQPCCSGISCTTTVDVPGVNDSLDCYSGTCRAYDEFFNTCFAMAWDAQAVGGAEPLTCASNPVCWSHYIEYKEYGCADNCWWSDSRVPPFVLWAGPYCQSR